jgi:hypothetical protein
MRASVVVLSMCMLFTGTINTIATKYQVSPGHLQLLLAGGAEGSCSYVNNISHRLQQCLNQPPVTSLSLITACQTSSC